MKKLSEKQAKILALIKNVIVNRHKNRFCKYGEKKWQKIPEDWFAVVNFGQPKIIYKKRRKQNA